MHARRPSGRADEDMTVYQLPLSHDRPDYSPSQHHRRRSSWNNKPSPSPHVRSNTLDGRDERGANLPLQVVNSLPRFIRTPRGLGFVLMLAIVGIIVLAPGSSEPKPSQLEGDRTPRARMRTAVLPVLRQSGKLINQISPRIGNRVESWVQQREEPVAPELTEEELERMTSHTFHPNGLLLVNPKGKHPILALIDRAEKAWRSKISRQSKTLAEAVAEYKRRYRRNPPKGFDDW